MPKNHNRVDTVFVLLIFCIFAASVFLILLLSGSIYQNIVDISKLGQNERIVLSYIRTKVRTTDSTNSIYIDTFNGLSAIFLEEVFEEHNFITLIYHYEGWVYELFHEKGLDFLPEQGIPIIEAGSLLFESIDNNLIRVSTDFGSLLIYPRSGVKSEREGY